MDGTFYMTIFGGYGCLGLIHSILTYTSPENYVVRNHKKENDVIDIISFTTMPPIINPRYALKFSSDYIDYIANRCIDEPLLDNFEPISWSSCPISEEMIEADYKALVPKPFSLLSAEPLYIYQTRICGSVWIDRNQRLVGNNKLQIIVTSARRRCLPLTLTSCFIALCIWQINKKR